MNLKAGHFSGSRKFSNIVSLNFYLYENIMLQNNVKALHKSDLSAPLTFFIRNVTYHSCLLYTMWRLSNAFLITDIWKLIFFLLQNMIMLMEYSCPPLGCWLAFLVLFVLNQKNFYIYIVVQCIDTSSNRIVNYLFVVLKNSFLKIIGNYVVMKILIIPARKPMS